MKKMSLTTQILIGLFLGALSGFLFGEYNAHIKIVGDAFIQLLQMAVLPYITVSLIAGIGSLTIEQAKTMAVKVGALIFSIWVLTFVVLLSFTWSFPSTVSASFFSEAMITPQESVDLLKLYIPSNPFFALSNNLVPAVVVFSIFLGIALINTEKKEQVIDLLQVLMKGLSKVTNYIVKLTPIGVFAITASALGTMPSEDFEKLQVYLIMYIVASLLFTFWILPLLVSALTPISFRDSIDYTKDALMTAFTTGNIFVVLPMIIDKTKEIFEKYELNKEKEYVDIVVPVTFNFPNAGKLLMLSFITFAAWFSGTDMGIGDYISYAVSGLVTMFGSTMIAIPFLLDLLHIPQDLFELYMMSNLVNTRMASLVAAMNIVAIAIIGAYAMSNGYQISKTRVIRSLILMAGGMVVTIAATTVYFKTMVNAEYKSDRIVMEMENRYPLKTVAETHLLTAPPALTKEDDKVSRFNNILARGELRVGYIPKQIPYSYFNKDGRLVGFDSDAAYALANDLGVKLVFIAVEHDKIPEALDNHLIDIAMSGLSQTSDNLRLFNFSDPYQSAVLGFITPDHRIKTFINVENIREQENLTLAVPFEAASMTEKLRTYLPNTQLKFEMIDDPNKYLQNPTIADAMLYDAVSGSTLTLMHPEFSAVVPQNNIYKVPVAYAIPPNDLPFTLYINNWIKMKSESGFFDNLYHYWMLGQDAAKEEPKWNVIDAFLNVKETREEERDEQAKLNVKQ